MFKHLLVPLDGSSLAEAALPAAAYLAQTLGATVTLVHVIERNAPQEIHGESHLSGPDEACAYLDEVARRAFPVGLHVERHVHTSEVSDVARSIVEHVGEWELRPDLVVMCTHGRHVPRDWLFGNIAQQVIALGTTPVLLVQPPEAGLSSFACRRLLVPLDGTTAHERGLAVAVDLAQACAAALHLLLVVPTLGTLSGERAATGRLLPGTMTALLDLAQQGAEEHLHRQVAQLQAAGLVVTAEVSRGDPATMIANTAQRVEADLIVLGTHGKTGLDAFWSGSVAPKISSRSHTPLLLVRVSRD
jgi:nucleotide-binding universal stress UspA family protein